MLSDLILHHYERSPFSEKVRLVLGFKRLAWRSVDTPVMLPKPDAVALTGGYRRAPFLQRGADIYCDSALICTLLEQLAPTPTLYPRESAGQQQLIAQWADSVLFWVAIPYTLQQPGGIAALFGHEPPDFMQRFGADRAAMTAGMRRATPLDGKAQLMSYLGWLNDSLADMRLHLGGEQPSIADFAVAHALWFIRLVPSLHGLFDDFPQLLASYERLVTACADDASQRTESSSADAIAVAAESAQAGLYAPAVVEAGLGFDAGAPVTVAAIDYASDLVSGTLVGLTRDEVVIERTDDRAGRVHVHFPRIGYQLKPIKN